LAEGVVTKFQWRAKIVGVTALPAVAVRQKKQTPNTICQFKDLQVFPQISVQEMFRV
jgi:hypothetical protein